MLNRSDIRFLMRKQILRGTFGRAKLSEEMEQGKLSF
jgi:hypothetical protein